MTEENIQSQVERLARTIRGGPLLASAQESSLLAYAEILRQQPVSRKEAEEQITRNRRLSESGRKQREDRRGT